MIGEEAVTGLPRAAGPDFRTTHWSVVLQAGAQDTPQTTLALEHLCHAYWFPLYAFVRRRGHGPEDAQDLTQEFLAELIARRDFARVDRNKGKFRSFLLAALSHFLAKDWRDRRALKRGGGQQLVPLDLTRAEHQFGTETAAALTPERCFDRQWAVAVMDQALARLRQEMARLGNEILFNELKIFLTEPAGEGGYDHAAVRLNLTPGAVATAVHRLRRRYRELVQETLAQTVTTPLELEEEMRYLLEVLSQ